MPSDPAAVFLLISIAVFVPAFVLPLLFAPVAWARMFRWRVPADLDLVRYFGRCVGGLALAIAVLAARAAFEPVLLAPALDTLLVAFVVLVGIHVWGAVRREQPWTENAEIALYSLFALAAAWFRFRA